VVRVAHSIFDAGDLLVTVRDLFEVPGATACLFYRSFINDTYRIEAGEQCYYLRVYQAGWRTRSEVEGEMHAIEAVHRAGGSVARPVAARDGGFVVELDAPEAIRPVVLFREAPGTDLSYGMQDGAANAYRYGAAVARLHDVTSTLSSPPGRKRLDLEAMLEAPRRIVSSRLTADGRGILEELCDRLRRVLTDRHDLTLGFCHGDLNSSNIHFEGDRATVLDFDCCGWGWIAGDIAAFARGVTLNRLPGRESFALIRSYLEGYQARRSISAADLESLPAFTLIQRLWVSALHLDGHHRWGNIYFGRPYAARLIEWLQAWAGVLDRRSPWSQSGGESAE
jgi:Ser/Thr protein kinase RdoA (MazF antagonist)